MMKRVVVFFVGAGMILVGLFAPTAGADSAATPDITVTHSGGAGSGQCLPAAMGSSATLSETADAWTIRISATAPICGSISAAIYQMPNNRLYPWPQHLLQAQQIDIGPGLTTISFNKTCTPTQFDLVDGPTPEYINPGTGPMVNLAYMFPWTGVQYWPSLNCSGSTSGGSTTTTAAPTTSTTLGPAVTTTTTTIAPAVEGVTTTIAPGVGGITQNPTTTTTPRAVESATATKTSATPTATVGDLAFTGASTTVLVYGGLALMAFGVITTVASRRRGSLQQRT